MNKIIEFKSLPGKMIFVKYIDGMDGEISLEKLAKRNHLSELSKIDIVENIILDEKSGDLIINGNITLCKNAMYGILELKKQMARLGIRLDA